MKLWYDQFLMPVERFVRHGNLPEASEVNESGRGFARMRELYYFGREIMNGRQALALAFTGIPGTELSRVGLTPETAGYVFIGNHQSLDPALRNTLIAGMNLVPRGAMPAWIEKCGCIYDDSDRMFPYVIRRPETVSLYGHLYREGDRELYRFAGTDFDGQTAATLTHERAHLAGETALSRPELLLDPRQPPVWAELTSQYGFRGGSVFTEWWFEAEFPILVPNQAAGTIDVVYADGSVGGHFSMKSK